MRIHVSPHACQIYNSQFSERGIPNQKWMNLLAMVQDKWLEVETEFLFADQFNTVPIDGVSEHGLRIMANTVDAIEGDVRDVALKCGWCGKCQVYDDRIVCEKCGKPELLRFIKVTDIVYRMESINGTPS